MAISEQKLNEVLGGIVANYRMKGCISTNALCDIMEKYDTNPNQIDFIYKSLAENGIQIIDEDARDKELFEQALSDIGLDDPVKLYLKDIGHVPLLSADEEVDLARRMQEGDERGEVGAGEVVGPHACIELIQPEVDGIRAVCHGGANAVPVAGRSQHFRLSGGGVHGGAGVFMPCGGCGRGPGLPDRWSPPRGLPA